MDMHDSKPKRVRRTLEQRHAAALVAVARAKDEIRRRDTREKVIVGALAIRRAMRNPASAAELIAMIEDEISSDADLLAVTDLLGRLQLASFTPIQPESGSGGAANEM